ncbi:Alpha/Beta hydrolase protein [Immersiella caudata]|uniref:Alpha/Beta hydrolase protein n=1 Tax=Immersiella caudata TaxID=314043 RepID=A0AA39U6C5_9PEZI|nr:Alpha/Beta hydrolase protein [Immersiella caudata]
MSLAAFGHIPPGIPSCPVPFSLHVPQHEIHTLTSLVHHSRIAAPSYYNTLADPVTGIFGVSRDWLASAQRAWSTTFSWREHEKYHNKFPNFRINVTVPSDGQVFDLHFAALFSKNESAVPITFLHGWPGSWLEFAGVLELLADKYTPETLPYHVVVPSIPDYGLSTRSEELTKELTMEGASEALNELMVALGFDAYVVQGGDVGSFLSQTICGLFDECKAFHLNMLFLNAEQTAAVANISLTPDEEERLKVVMAWAETGSAYAAEHATRPSTISLALNTSPLGMLAWMGEKFIEWSDNRNSEPLSLDTILSTVSFYWFTDSYSRALWAYRALIKTIGGPLPPMPMSKTKPFGFSAFPREIATVTQSWAEFLFPNLVFYGPQKKGGHFAALQEPEAFLGDIEKFLAIVGPSVVSSKKR